MAGATTARSYHHGDVRRAALDAALVRLRRDGDASVTVRAIAADIGVTHGALYRHFKNRDDLMDALGEVAYDRLAERLTSATDLQSFVGAYLDFAIEEQHLYWVAMTRHNSAINDGGALHKAVRRVVAEAVRVFGAEEDDEASTRSTVMRNWMLLHGAVGLELAGALQQRSRDQLVSLVATLMEHEA